MPLNDTILAVWVLTVAQSLAVVTIEVFALSTDNAPTPSARLASDAVEFVCVAPHAPSRGSRRFATRGN
jgi:hypothetical protein